MSEVHISRLLRDARRPLLSLEFFPPKDDAAIQRLTRTVEALKEAEPDFVTVTYGAGGTTQQKTLEVCGMLRRAGFAPVMPHLTCVGASRNDLDDIVHTIHRAGYRNIMALRGDPPRGKTAFEPHPDGLLFARDLVERITSLYADICCGVAGYPEVHPEAASAESDVENIRRKIEAGGSFVTTQLFYDNQNFYRYVERCRVAGITVPIIPGLLPAVSLRQAQRITSMCKATLPDRLVRELAEAGEDADAASEVGIRWVARQVEELLEHGVPGIHLYILNRVRTGLAPSILEPIRRRRT